MSQLDMKRVEVPLKPILDLLGNPLRFGYGSAMKKYIKQLRANLSENKLGITEPVGFSLAMRQALNVLPRNQQTEIVGFFPEILEKIWRLRGDYEKFVAEVQKFARQFNEHIRTMDRKRQ
jgi:hypothetical protein